MSHIDTAPASRKPVLTYIKPWDPQEIETALKKELARGGQAFYVVPRIRDIPHHVEMLQDLLKGARKGRYSNTYTPPSPPPPPPSSTHPPTYHPSLFLPPIYSPTHPLHRR